MNYQDLENKALKEFDEEFRHLNNLSYNDFECTELTDVSQIAIANYKIFKDFLKSHLKEAYEAGENAKGVLVHVRKDDAIKQAIAEERNRIGKEFKEWFHACNIVEPIEDAIERITGVKC